MKQRIINYIRAGYAGLYLVSPEEQRVEAILKGIAQEVDFQLFAWSTTDGLIDLGKGSARPCGDPMEVLLAFQELPEKSILVLRDFHLFLHGDPNPVLVRQLKYALQEAKTKNKPIVILGCRLCLPPELERELTIIEFALPGKQELGRVLVKQIEGQPAEVWAVLHGSLDVGRERGGDAQPGHRAAFDFGLVLGGGEVQGRQVQHLAAFIVQDGLVAQGHAPAFTARTRTERMHGDVVGLGDGLQGVAGMARLAAGFASGFLAQAARDRGLGRTVTRRGLAAVGAIERGLRLQRLDLLLQDLDLLFGGQQLIDHRRRLAARLEQQFLAAS